MCIPRGRDQVLLDEGNEVYPESYGQRFDESVVVLVCAEVEDPMREIPLGRGQVVSVQVQKGRHGVERQPLVPIEEGLPLGDALRKDRGLQGYIGVAILRLRDGALESRFQFARRTEPIEGLLPGVTELVSEQV